MTQKDDAERAAFEAAWHAEYPLHSKNAFIRSHFIPDAYVTTRVQDGWLMWQARSALDASTEPVGEVYEHQDGTFRIGIQYYGDAPPIGTKLYTRPAASKHQGAESGRFAQEAVRMLEGYAESYESMSRMNGGDNTVHCSSVAFDIRHNMAGWIKNRAAQPQQPDSEAPDLRVDDLRMLVQRLVHALNKASPGNDLGAKALDYLMRNDLGPSVLRGEAPENDYMLARALKNAEHEQSLDAYVEAPENVIADTEKPVHQVRAKGSLKWQDLEAISLPMYADNDEYVVRTLYAAPAIADTAKPDEYRDGTEHSQVLADLSAGEFKPMFPELQDQHPVGEFVGYQKIGFQQVPIIRWNRHVPMGTMLYAAPAIDAAQDEASDSEVKREYTQAELDQYQRLLHARSELGRTIADPMWADHAEVSKAALKRWHKTIDAAISQASKGNGNG